MPVKPAQAWWTLVSRVRAVEYVLLLPRALSSSSPAQKAHCWVSVPAAPARWRPVTDVDHRREADLSSSNAAFCRYRSGNSDARRHTPELLAMYQPLVHGLNAPSSSLPYRHHSCSSAVSSAVAAEQPGSAEAGAAPASGQWAAGQAAQALEEAVQVAQTDRL